MKMIPYGRQSIDKKDIRAVVDVLRSDWLTQGPAIITFERSLADYCGAKYVVAVANGTAALHLAYSAAGLEKGDEIITTPNTFVATTNMALVLGIKPVFCDIRLDTYTIDESRIERAITKKTKAIVPVHFAGHPCDRDAIRRIAKKHRLIVIEDSCHALGASYKREKIGGRSDLSVFSFHPVKSITTGEGGAIATDNKRYYESMRYLRNHGIYKDASGKNVMTELGFNYRMTDMQAALGRSQLAKLDVFVERRREVVKKYENALNGFEHVILPKELPHNQSAWHIYVIRTADPVARDPLAAHLKAAGIGVNFHYPAVYSHPYYRTHGWKHTHLPHEEEYQRSCITLPCYPGLTTANVQFIAKTIKRFWQ